MKIDYTLIGSIPEVEGLRDQLPALIEAWEKRTASKMEQVAMGVAIEMCAQHFYGINIQECESILTVIDAIKSMDQELQVK